MSKSTAFFAYSIGKKVVMALTGLFLISFLVVHMSGNLQLFTENPVAFNEYTRFMTHSPLIKLSELVLVVGFALHVYFAGRLGKLNNEARPEKYHYKKEEGSSSWMSRNMGITGSVILIFLGIHLYMFYGIYHYGAGEPVEASIAFKEVWKLTEPVNVTLNNVATTIPAGGFLSEEAAKVLNGQQVKGVSMYKVASDSFKQWWIVLFYLASMLLLTLHLRHGFQSAFRSLGLVHKKYTPIIEVVGILLCIVVPLLFALMPIYHFFR